MSRPTADQMKEFWAQVSDGRINSANLQAFLNNPSRFVEDQGASLLAELIAAGNYDCPNSDITPENFPLESDGADGGEPVLVHLDRTATTDEVLAELDRRGLKPARIEHLLRYGADHPEEQRQYPIVCLGSSLCLPRCLPRGRRRFPFLGEGDGVRELNLSWSGPVHHWRGVFRFLALRK